MQRVGRFIFLCCALLLLAVPRGAAAQPYPNAYPVPSDPRERIGVYNWGVDPWSRGGWETFTWGNAYARNLDLGFNGGFDGPRTLRVKLGTRDDYQFGGLSTDLVNIASRWEYHSLFNDAYYKTILLTVYTAQDEASAWWQDGWSGAWDERNQISALGQHLLRNYPNKTFIILNWEGDNAVDARSIPTYHGRWDRMVTWTQARALGVSDARGAVWWSSSRLYSGLEFNLVRGCNSYNSLCVISYVAPKVTGTACWGNSPFASCVPVDYFSYSSYQSMGIDTADSDVYRRLYDDLSAARAFIPTVANSRFIVGEFGNGRQVPAWGECRSAQRTASAINALRDWGAGYGIAWQIIDNPPSAPWGGLGLFKYDLSSSLLRGTMRNLYLYNSPYVPWVPTCPRINDNGIVDGTTWQPVYRRGAILSIFGQGFTPGTSQVVVEQFALYDAYGNVRRPGRRWVVGAGSTAWWNGNTGQINFQLPWDVVPSEYNSWGQPQPDVTVYVRTGFDFAPDPDTLDSNGQLLFISP
jgi:hypothetical protein